MQTPCQSQYRYFAPTPSTILRDAMMRRAQLPSILTAQLILYSYDNKGKICWSTCNPLLNNLPCLNHLQSSRTICNTRTAIKTNHLRPRERRGEGPHWKPNSAHEADRPGGMCSVRTRVQYCTRSYSSKVFYCWLQAGGGVGDLCFYEAITVKT